MKPEDHTPRAQLYIYTRTLYAMDGLDEHIRKQDCLPLLEGQAQIVRGVIAWTISNVVRELTVELSETKPKPKTQKGKTP
jgi:hypothetical protein